MIKCESIHVNAAIGNLRRNIKTSGIVPNVIRRLKKAETRICGAMEDWKKSRKASGKGKAGVEYY